MELYNVLEQYELDWAYHSASHQEYPYDKLKNKAVYVSGTQEFLTRAVVYFLFGLNDLQKLNIKITLVSETSTVLNYFFPALLKREDFTFRMLDDVKTVDDKANFFIYTGCCGKAIDRLPETFLKETEYLKKSLDFAGTVKTDKVILLSDYRVYGKIDRGVYISEHEYGNIDLTKGSGYDAELLQTLEMLVTIYGNKYNFRHTVLRSGILLGTDTEIDNNLFFEMFKAVAENKKFSIVRSQKKYSFTYINDLLNAIFWVMTELLQGEDLVYNVVSKDCTMSTGMLAEKIYDIYPEKSKIELIDIGKEPCYGVAMNCQRLPVAGFEPEVTMDEIIQLMVNFYEDKDKMFLYKNSHNGKLDNIHRILTGYLLDVDRICKKYNIQYFLGGGTLLGAIRHNGFIPWDDDADIMMLREDYEKFLKVAQHELPPTLFLQTSDTDKYCHYPFAKIRIQDTVYATYYSKSHINMNNGMAFDIFAHDKTANSNLGRKLHLQFTLLFRAMIFNKWNKRKVNNGHRIQSFFANILKFLFPIKLSEWFQYKCIRFFEKKKDAKYLYDGMGRNVYKGDFPAYYLDEAIEWEFEGHKFPVPKEYDKYLRYLYGDYIQLVLPWQRQNCHDIVSMDLGEYSKYYLPNQEKDGSES